MRVNADTIWYELEDQPTWKSQWRTAIRLCIRRNLNEKSGWSCFGRNRQLWPFDEPVLSQNHFSVFRCTTVGVLASTPPPATPTQRHSFLFGTLRGIERERIKSRPCTWNLEEGQIDDWEHERNLKHEHVMLLQPRTRNATGWLEFTSRRPCVLLVALVATVVTTAAEEKVCSLIVALHCSEFVKFIRSDTRIQRDLFTTTVGGGPNEIDEILEDNSFLIRLTNRLNVVEKEDAPLTDQQTPISQCYENTSFINVRLFFFCLQNKPCVGLWKMLMSCWKAVSGDCLRKVAVVTTKTAAVPSTFAHEISEMCSNVISNRVLPYHFYSYIICVNL